MENILARYNQLLGKVKALEDDIDAKESQIQEKNELSDDLAKAIWIITEVQEKTQEKFRQKIEGLVTMAIQSVYDRPFGLELFFDRRGGKLTCQAMLYESIDGQKEYYDDPKEELGGGIVDICSFALRIVLWTLEKPRSRNLFLLDEPGKNLGDLLPLFGNMLKELSHKLGVQLIIITHDDALIEIADKSWRVTHDGRESFVKEIMA